MLHSLCACSALHSSLHLSHLCFSFSPLAFLLLSACSVTSDVVYCDKGRRRVIFMLFFFSRLVAAEGAEPRFMQEEEESSEEEEEELSPKEQG